MKGICPVCAQVSELKPIHKSEELVVRGETIPIEEDLFECSSCGEEFKDPKSKTDVLAMAFEEYRRRHGMLAPEAIQSFRKHFGLTQSELSNLLHWGGATLSRYENGALPNEAHEKMLQMVMEPDNLLRLIESHPAALSDTKRESLIEELRKEREVHAPRQLIADWVGRLEPDQYTGYRRLELDKLLNMILFFCSDKPVFKTKMNKLLFYADFDHFKECAVSITGSSYLRFQHGPVPEGFDVFYSLLETEGAIDVAEVFFDIGSGEELLAVKKPDMNIFTESEIATLIFVKKYFEDFTSRGIRDFSHQEEGYKKTEDRTEISYLFSGSLQI
jgi:putative zinc finger/helix-turn-helix YgiT family protein